MLNPSSLFVLALWLPVLLAQAALEDPEWARRIRAGDAQAFKAFFDRYHGHLLHYLRRMGVPEAVCHDLIQQAFLILWEKRSRIDPGQSLKGLLFKTGHNRALNHFRDQRKFEPESALSAFVGTQSPERDAEHALIQQALHAAVTALPERRRAVFELCFMQELTYREAAEALGISIKTVEHQMGHALKAVRKALSRYR